MTNLQVDFWKYEETVRSDKAREEETHRTNVRNEELRAGELAETTRHNKATESIEWARVGVLAQQVKETERHNRANEANDSRRTDIENFRVSNWVRQQDVTLRQAEQRLEIDRERNTLDAQHNSILQQQTDLQREKMDRDYIQRSQELDQRQQQIDIELNEQKRRWFDTVFNAGVNVVDQVRRGYEAVSKNSREQAKFNSWTSFASES